MPEQEYIDGMMQIFRFTPEQKDIVKKDLLVNVNITILFRALKTPELRRQYFSVAHALLYSDGNFSEKKKDVIKSIVALLDPAEKANLAGELAWIEQQPLPPAPSDDSKALVMKNMFSRMLGFYNKVVTNPLSIREL